MNIKIVICLCIGFNAGVFGIIERIVGGENAEIKNFPYLVSLRRFSTNAHFCGGSIISRHHVLTVAHCLINKQPFNDIKIYTASSSSLLTNGPSYNIKYVNIHPEYVEELSKLSKYQHDISIITVEGVIRFTKFQKKIKLPTHDVTNSDNAVVAGWGVLAYKAPIMSDQLQQARMIILDSISCRHAIPYIHDEQICGFQRPGVGACMGDSGSPLVSNGIIVGLVTYAIPCAKGLPDVYTNVYSYLSFINSVINKKKT